MPRPRSFEIVFVAVLAALVTAVIRSGEASPSPDEPAATRTTTVSANPDGRVVRIVYQPLVRPR